MGNVSYRNEPALKIFWCSLKQKQKFDWIHVQVTMFFVVFFYQASILRLIIKKNIWINHQYWQGSIKEIKKKTSVDDNGISLLWLGDQLSCCLLRICLLSTVSFSPRLFLICYLICQQLYKYIDGCCISE